MIRCKIYPKQIPPTWIWLVVSIHYGNLPQVVVKIKNLWNHHLGIFFYFPLFCPGKKTSKPFKPHLSILFQKWHSRGAILVAARMGRIRFGGDSWWVKQQQRAARIGNQPTKGSMGLVDSPRFTIKSTKYMDPRGNKQPTNEQQNDKNKKNTWRNLRVVFLTFSHWEFWLTRVGNAQETLPFVVFHQNTRAERKWLPLKLQSFRIIYHGCFYQPTYIYYRWIPKC